MAKKIIKLTPTKAVVKIIDSNETISLATDLLFAGQTVSGSPKVYITGVLYSNTGVSSHIHITRNGDKVLCLGFAQDFKFENYAITEQPTSDIVVVCPTDSFVILELTKTEGYSDVISNVGA
jgi:hypothetical protein